MAPSHTGPDADDAPAGADPAVVAAGAAPPVVAPAGDGLAAPAAAPSVGESFAVPADAVVIPVVAERLTVDRRVVETGAVRLRKQVHEHVVTVDEPLAAEAFDIERVAVGRPVDGPVAVRHEGDVMIVPVVEERLVVRKELVLVEELRLTRRTRVHHAPQSVTLRREEIVAERLDPASGAWKPIDAAADGGAADAAAPSSSSPYDPAAA